MPIKGIGLSCLIITILMSIEKTLGVETSMLYVGVRGVLVGLFSCMFTKYE